MKKTILIAILLTISTVVLSKVVIPELPTSDIEGSEDHPLLKRYADSYIVVDQRKSFDEFTFPTSKLATKTHKVRTDTYHIDQSKTVEGPYTRLVYLLPAERSPLEVLRNYQDEIVAQGGSVLYECKREECGGHPGRGIQSSSDVRPSLAMVLRSRKRLGLKEYSQGFCATIGNIVDQRYLVAELPDVGAYISIHTYTIKDFYYTNCNAFIGRTVAVVDIVEGKPREKNMVIVEASDMAQQISETGSVSLYGIFFDTNSATIKDDSEATLQEIAKLFQQQPDLNLLVVGHTDNEGAFEYNMNLSQNRAQSVVDELSAKYGIAQERLVPVGASYISPVSSNETEEGRALNRRVELVKNQTQ